jgi:hypothetical protein
MYSTYVRGVSANKAKGIITIGAQRRTYGEQKLDKFFFAECNVCAENGYSFSQPVF